jgi:hypothetical protein
MKNGSLKLSAAVWVRRPVLLSKMRSLVWLSIEQLFTRAMEASHLLLQQRRHPGASPNEKLTSVSLGMAVDSSSDSSFSSFQIGYKTRQILLALAHIARGGEAVQSWMKAVGKDAG